jgi:MFS transporter, putative metabolite:H+ symporter
MAEQTTLASNDSITSLPEEHTEQADARVFFAMLEKAGTAGRYQQVITLLWCLVGYLCGGLMLIIPYLFYQDPYDCSGKYPGADCQEYVCSLDASLRGDYLPAKSFSSLANEFGDFRCSEEKLQLDSIITVMYVGTVVGFLLLTLVGDLLGRKLLISLCMLLTVVGLTIAIFCSSLAMAGAGLFLATVGIQNAYNICFFFIAETVSEEYREKASVAIQLFYGLGVLLNVLWYYWVGDWQLIFALFYFVPAVAVTVGVVVVVRDTPICLVMRNSPLKALRDFRFIASMNRKRSFRMDVEEIEEVKARHGKGPGDSKTKEKRFSILDLFRFGSLRGMTLMLILLQCTIIFEFYAPALMLDKFKMNIFINGLVVGVSELISYPICYFLIMKSRRQFIAYGCFAATFVCSAILTFMWNQEEENPAIGESIGVLAFIFLFRFAISLEYTFFYVYFNELYPTQVRVIGTSMVSVMGGIMVTIAPEIIDGCIHSGFPIMILFAVLSALSAACSYKLPETLHKVPADVVEELRASPFASMMTNPEDPSDGLKEILLKGGKSTNYSSS